MSVQNFAIIDGFDNEATLINVENHLYDRATKPRRFQISATPVGVGETITKTLDGKTHYDGAVLFEWRYRILPIDGFTVSQTLIMGSTTADNNAVTTRTRKRDTTFANYNAEVTLEPDYELRKGRDGIWYVLNIVYAFQVVEAL